MGEIYLARSKKALLSIQNRDKLATVLDVDVDIIVGDLRDARENKVISEDEYDNYVFYIRQYFHRLGNKIKKIKSNKETK